MAKGDQKGPQPPETSSTPNPASRARPAEDLRGTYGSGGSYGVGGGFDDDQEGRDSVPDDPDGRPARTARSEAQQEGQQIAGFEREVDPDAAPPKFHDEARTPEEEQLAAKNRRGSRL